MTDDDLLFAFYGDDLTGSTDALEGLALNGVHTRLFLEPPTNEDLDRFESLNAVGIAGTSRSMTPAEMTDALPPVFKSLGELDPEMVHYKVCSTFDSAPDLGSIGKAIDIAQDAFDSSFVPVSQGSTVPHGRYVVFGNLFAVQDGELYRIDQHPTMSEHPATPMTESDLRRHLGKQTEKNIGLVDIRDLRNDQTAAEALDEAIADNEIVVFDTYETDHLERIGRLVWDRATRKPGPLFAVGSSGFEHHALPPQWRSAGAVEAETLLEKQPPSEQIAVISGSASPVTAEQIDWATEHGFEAIRLDTTRLVDPGEAPAEREAARQRALEAVDSGQSVILYSVSGPNDPIIERTKRRFAELDVDENLESRLGRLQGFLFGDIVRETGLQRVCVAGGDTSGYVVPELDIQALEALAPTAPGSPLCRAMAGDPAFHGLEIALKGGQTGSENYFELVRRGGITPD